MKRVRADKQTDGPSKQQKTTQTSQPDNDPSIVLEDQQTSCLQFYDIPHDLLHQIFREIVFDLTSNEIFESFTVSKLFFKIWHFSSIVLEMIDALRFRNWKTN